MSEAVLARDPARAAPGTDALKASAAAWFVAALVGQWLFAAYVVGYYGPRFLESGLAGMRGTPLTGGYIAGDLVGNLMAASHIVLAVLIHGGGPLQLVPQIRRRAPAFHRWNGRTFMAAAVVASLTGLYMHWVRGSGSGLLNSLGNTATSALVFVFAALALREGMARNIAAHRRWALRLFMVASAVWFIRLGYHCAEVLARVTHADFDAIEGPLMDVLNFAKLAIPLGVLELYFWAQSRAGAAGRAAVAGVLFGATALTAIGIYATVATSWLPRMMG
jgi:hypothetical protein